MSPKGTREVQSTITTLTDESEFLHTEVLTKNSLWQSQTFKEISGAYKYF